MGKTEQYDLHIFGKETDALRIEMVQPKHQEPVSLMWVKQHPWFVTFALVVSLLLVLGALYFSFMDAYSHTVEKANYVHGHGASLLHFAYRQPRLVTSDEAHTLEVTVQPSKAISQTAAITVTVVTEEAGKFVMSFPERSYRTVENVLPGSSVSISIPFQVFRISSSQGRWLQRVHDAVGHHEALKYHFRVEMRTASGERMVGETDTATLYPVQAPMRTIARSIGILLSSLLAAAASIGLFPVVLRRFGIS